MIYILNFLTVSMILNLSAIGCTIMMTLCIPTNRLVRCLKKAFGDSVILHVNLVTLAQSHSDLSNN